MYQLRLHQMQLQKLRSQSMPLQQLRMQEMRLLLDLWKVGNNANLPYS
jgi:hypothetical protein